MRSRAGQCAALPKQVPGFLELSVTGVCAAGVEEDFGLVVGGADGEDVPGVLGEDVGGAEVDLVGAVRASVGVEMAAVGVPALLAGALHPFGRCRSLRAGSGREESVRGFRRRGRSGRCRARAW